MATPFVNRKKVRGWKRRLRQLERFRLIYSVLDIQRLRAREVEYVKLWLDPWHRLVKRNPPFWYRRRVVAAFIDILQSWKAQLDGLNEPYYLRFWLFDPRFYSTQVVAAVGSRILFYERSFNDAPGMESSPPKPYHDAGYDLHALQWHTVLDEEYFLASVDAESEEDRVYLRNAASREEIAPDGDTLYIMKRGLIWIGAMPPIDCGDPRAAAV